MLGKLKSMIALLRNDVIIFTSIKGLMLSIDGNGSGNPTINVNYNILSVVRIGVGVYRITVKQGTFYGKPLNGNGIITSAHTIQANAVSEAHFVTLSNTSATEFDIEVTEMTVGGGNKLEINPYDILVGDGISVSLLLNLGLDELPPE